MRISVIIPSYNSARTIGETIQSVLNQPRELLGEVWVADSSDDGRTRAVIHSFIKDARVKVLELERRTMPALARNAAAMRAAGDLLAFIDSDATADAGWLERMAQAYSEGCRTGGGAILLPEYQRWKMIPAAQYFLQFNEFMPAGHRRGVRFVPSCNLFCDKTIFKSVGGFPEIRAFEDVIFGELIRPTAPVMFDPSIRVYHIFGESGARLFGNQSLLGRYALKYRRRTSSRWIYRGYWPVLIVPGILMIKLIRIVGRVIRSSRGTDGLVFAAAFPVLLAGLFAWGYGFLSGCGEKG